MENLEIFNKVRQVPEGAKKQFSSATLKDFTDINPMWRIMVLTETFGACGFGWKYEIVKQWSETYGNVVKTYCNINLYVKIGDEWSAPIPGTGGSSAVSETRNYLSVSDECYKMALTDALSVSMKALGVGADVYWEKGANYETKYDQPLQAQPLQAQPLQAQPQQQEQTKAKQPQQPVQPATVIPDNIKKEIEAAQSLDELKQIQAKHPDYKADVTFKGLLNARYSKLK